MSSTLLTFREKYCQFGEKDIKIKGLAIGGYKSTFLADLLASYLFEKYNNQFKEVLWKEIYRNNELLVFKGKKSLSERKGWRDDFQSRVDKSQAMNTKTSRAKFGYQAQACQDINKIMYGK